MRFFDFKKKGSFVDLSRHREKENWPLADEDIESKNSLSEKRGELNLEKPGTSEERKKKFAKRITELTDTIEDLTNQIYHLQQRVELLERKLNVHRE